MGRVPQRGCDHGDCRGRSCLGQRGGELLPQRSWRTGVVHDGRDLGDGLGRIASKQGAGGGRAGVRIHRTREGKLCEHRTEFLQLQRPDEINGDPNSTRCIRVTSEPELRQFGIKPAEGDPRKSGPRVPIRDFDHATPAGKFRQIPCHLLSNVVARGRGLAEHGIGCRVAQPDEVRFCRRAIAGAVVSADEETQLFRELECRGTQLAGEWLAIRAAGHERHLFSVGTLALLECPRIERRLQAIDLRVGPDRRRLPLGKKRVHHLGSP